MQSQLCASGGAATRTKPAARQLSRVRACVTCAAVAAPEKPMPSAAEKPKKVRSAHPAAASYRQDDKQPAGCGRAGAFVQLTRRLLSADWCSFATRRLSRAKRRRRWATVSGHSPRGGRSRPSRWGGARPVAWLSLWTPPALLLTRSAPGSAIANERRSWAKPDVVLVSGA